MNNYDKTMNTNNICYTSLAFPYGPTPTYMYSKQEKWSSSID